MKKEAMRSRLAKVDDSLTPKQSIMAMIEGALSRFESLHEYDTWQEGRPLAPQFDPVAVRSALRARRRTAPPEIVEAEFRREFTQRMFLVELWRLCNRSIEETRTSQFPFIAISVIKSNQIAIRAIDRLKVFKSLELMLHELCKGNADDARTETKLRGCDPMIEELQQRLDAIYPNLNTETGPEESLGESLGELLAMRGAVTAIGEMHFGARQIVFAENYEQFEELIAEAEANVRIRNDLRRFSAGADAGHRRGQRNSPSKINLDKINQAVHNDSGVIVDRLVKEAEARTRGLISACDIVARKGVSPKTLMQAYRELP
jgi:hypothetical protein